MMDRGDRGRSRDGGGDGVVVCVRGPRGCGEAALLMLMAMSSLSRRWRRCRDSINNRVGIYPTRHDKHLTVIYLDLIFKPWEF